jgi:catechol 2,3-dioxygenase-like lactoylglutathione lyase family enzyme
MVRIGNMVINVTDVHRAAEFWGRTLGYVPRNEGSLILVPPDGRDGPGVALDETDRTHLDLYAADAEEQQAEVERLIGLGAERVADWPYPDDPDFVVLADPDGNVFCVVDASHT